MITKDEIKLPFMGKDKFIALMRAGLGYNRQTRLFYVEDSERIEQVKGVLSEILKDEVTFAQKCFLCNATFTCNECDYAEVCRSRDLPSYCICPLCRSQTQLYHHYIEKGDKSYATSPL